jgi:hypothetical protein
MAKTSVPDGSVLTEFMNSVSALAAEEVSATWHQNHTIEGWFDVSIDGFCL